MLTSWYSHNYSCIALILLLTSLTVMNGKTNAFKLKKNGCLMFFWYKCSIKWVLLLVNTKLSGIDFAVKYFLLKSWLGTSSPCLVRYQGNLWGIKKKKEKIKTGFSTCHALWSLNFLCSDHLIHLTEAGFLGSWASLSFLKHRFASH